MDQNRRNIIGEYEIESHKKAKEILEKVKQREKKEHLIAVKIDHKTTKYMTEQRAKQYYDELERNKGKSKGNS